MQPPALRRLFRRLLCCLSAALALAQPAGAQLFIYNGPFTGTGPSANPWSADSWIGGTPVSGATAQLVFRNFGANSYTANNDLGNPFALNAVTLRSFSSANTTISSAAGNSLQLTGTDPTVTMTGPGNFTFGTGGNGLVLNPTSGATTTFGGSGAGIVFLGGNLPGSSNISGSGGLVINNTGAGGVSIAGSNTFTGGVTLNRGSLGINSGAALGAASNVLTVNGGTLRTAVDVTIANAVLLNSDLVFTAGRLTMNGAVSGSGGVRVFNATNFDAQALNSGNAANNLTFGGALTFAGSLAVQNSVPQSGGTNNLAVVTLTSTATLGSAQPIVIGNNGSLVLIGNALHILNANNLVLNGGRLGFTGVSGGNFAETFGNVTASGLNTFTVNTTSGGAANHTLTFGNLTRQNNATLFFRGDWNGGNNKLTFANGLTTVSDPLAPGSTGQYTAIVPFATGNTSSAGSNAATRITYDAVTGIGYISPLDSSRVYQASSGEVLTGANVDFKNVNFTGDAVVADARRVNSLSVTDSGTISGGGTLMVSSGAVILVNSASAFPVNFNGPTLDFGGATGYLHLGGDLIIRGASAITGSGGVVVSGLNAPGTGGLSGGYTVRLFNASNPFTGGLFVNGNATINYTGDAQLGAAGGAIALNGGGLHFDPTAPAGVTVNRPITLGEAGGSLSGSGGSSVTVAGSITGSGPLLIGSPAESIARSGIVTLTGNNAFTGPIYIGGATLRAGSDANLGSSSAPVNFQGTGGTLQFTASGTFAKPISFSLGSSPQGGGTLDIGGNAITLTGPLSGNAPSGLNIVGGGTLTLAASSPLFSGSISAGMLTLAAPDTLPQVTVLSTGTLAGNGFVGGTVFAGTLAPGVGGAGLLGMGRLTLTMSSTFQIELNGALPGTGYDQVIVGDLVTLGNATLALSLGFNPADDTSFTIIDNQGTDPVSGTFNGLAEGATVSAGDETFVISYHGGDGNNVVLTAAGAVPEPSTCALLLTGSGALWLFLTRRRVVPVWQS